MIPRELVYERDGYRKPRASGDDPVGKYLARLGRK